VSDSLPQSLELLITENFVDRFVAAFPMLPMAVATIGRDRRVKHWNALAETLSGWPASEIVGQQLTSLTNGPLQASDVLQILHDVEHSRSWSGDLIIRRRDGHATKVNAVVTQMLGEDGQADGLLVIAREDVADLESALAELAQIRMISQQIDDVRIETARDIAGRLHDDLSAQCHLLLVRTREILESESLTSSAASRLQELEHAQTTLVNSLQGIWRSLRPPLLDDFGLCAALEQIAISSIGPDLETIDAEIDPSVDSITGPVREVIVLIAQEALANVVTHARATTCTFTVTYDEFGLCIDVTDNGVGFHDKEGFGLRLMRERTRRFGGVVDIGPGPNGGTSLLVRLDPNWKISAPLESLIDPHVMMRASRGDTGEIVDFVVTELNEAAVERFERPRQQCLGMKMLDILPGLVGTNLFDAYVRVMETGEPLILDDIVYAYTPGRPVRRYDIRAVRVGEQLSYTWRDVTERHDLLERYRTLAENTRDVVVVGSVNGPITWVSPSITELLGWRPDEVVGRTFESLVEPSQLTRIREEQASGDYHTFPIAEFQVLAADGSWRWVASTVRDMPHDSHGVQTRIATWRDVEAVIRARQELRESGERFRLLAENSSDVVYHVDREGVIQWVSPSVESELGWSPEEFIGTTSSDHTDSADWEKIVTMRHSLLAGGRIEPSEMRFRTREGQMRWMSYHVKPVTSEDDFVTGAVVGLNNCQDEVAARRALETFSAASRVLVRAVDESTMLSEICKVAVDVGGYLLAAFVQPVDDEAKSLRKVAASGETSYMDSVVITWDNAPTGQGPTGLAVREAKVQVANDLQHLATYEPWSDLASTHGFRSSATFPVVIDGHVDGALLVYSPETGAFDDYAVKTFSDLTDAVGICLRRIRSQQQ
jgi:PAS domain S-box-containing protein